MPDCMNSSAWQHCPSLSRVLTPSSHAIACPNLHFPSACLPLSCLLCKQCVSSACAPGGVHVRIILECIAAMAEQHQQVQFDAVPSYYSACACGPTGPAAPPSACSRPPRLRSAATHAPRNVVPHSLPQLAVSVLLLTGLAGASAHVSTTIMSTLAAMKMMPAAHSARWTGRPCTTASHRQHN